MIPQEEAFMSKVTSGATEVDLGGDTKGLRETDVDPEFGAAAGNLARDGNNR